eukprot:3466250-Prymnesium_polylepis.1
MRLELQRRSQKGCERHLAILRPHAWCCTTTIAAVDRKRRSHTLEPLEWNPQHLRGIGCCLVPEDSCNEGSMQRIAQRTSAVRGHRTALLRICVLCPYRQRKCQKNAPPEHPQRGAQRPCIEHCNDLYASVSGAKHLCNPDPHQVGPQLSIARDG